MPSRITRTQTAVRVAEFLTTREGKSHLEQYGWFKGMPVVITNHVESLNDAMGMVSVHGRAVLLAMIAPGSDHLQLLYITTPQNALRVVDVASPKKTSGQFFKEVLAVGSKEFRVKHWRHTAVALAIPTCEAMKNNTRDRNRYQLLNHAQSNLQKVGGLSRRLERV